MSAVALAWLLRRSPVMVSIPGTKSLEHLSDNISATKVVTELTGGEVRALTAVENEESATLSTMPARMLDALRRRADIQPRPTLLTRHAAKQQIGIECLRAASAPASPAPSPDGSGQGDATASVPAGLIGSTARLAE